MQPFGNGKQRGTFGTHLGCNERKRIQFDRFRVEEQGIKVLRFCNARLRREKEMVRGAIWQALLERAPMPMPEYCRPGVVGSVDAEKNEPSG